MFGRLGVAGFCPDLTFCDRYLASECQWSGWVQEGAVLRLTLDLCNSSGVPSCGPECTEPLGCDWDESDASRSAISGGGNSKVSKQALGL